MLGVHTYMALNNGAGEQNERSPDTSPSAVGHPATARRVHVLRNSQPPRSARAGVYQHSNAAVPLCALMAIWRARGAGLKKPTRRESRVAWQEVSVLAARYGIA